MIRIRPSGMPAAIALLLLTVASCGQSSPTQPEPVLGGLAAPVLTRPVCGAVSKWPDSPFAIAWEAVASASAYTIEIDCLGCGSGTDAWASQSGTPWQVRAGLQSPFYANDVIDTLRRDGGRTMRWRVWAVDAAGHDGAKSDWCVAAFSDSGLPTPGGGVP